MHGKGAERPASQQNTHGDAFARILIATMQITGESRLGNSTVVKTRESVAAPIPESKGNLLKTFCGRRKQAGGLPTVGPQPEEQTIAENQCGSQQGKDET